MVAAFVGRQIVSIGCSYKNPRGGVAMVLNVYSRCVYSRFRCLVNSGGNTRFYKLLVALWAYFCLLVLLLFDRDVKIVHIHTSSYNSFHRSSYFVKLSKRFHKKVVLHVHGGGFKEYYESNPQKISKILNICDVIIVLSETWKIFFQRITSVPIEIVNNVVEHPVDAMVSMKKEKLCILFMGAIVKEKGVFDLLQTVGEHMETFHDKIEVHIGGAGDVGELKEQISHYGLGDIVYCHGWVSGDEKVTLFSQSDVYVLPSYAEGLPVSILEAMSYKKAIVASSVGGIPEIVEDGVNGFLITPGNRTQLFMVLNDLLVNREKIDRMGDASYQKIQSYFPESVSQQLSNIYSKLLQ